MPPKMCVHRSDCAVGEAKSPISARRFLRPQFAAGHHIILLLCKKILKHYSFHDINVVEVLCYIGGGSPFLVSNCSLDLFSFYYDNIYMHSISYFNPPTHTGWDVSMLSPPRRSLFQSTHPHGVGQQKQTIIHDCFCLSYTTCIVYDSLLFQNSAVFHTDAQK